MKLTTGKDAGEDLNVRRVHGQIMRELDEPHELNHHVPWWIKHLIYAPLIMWSVYYFFYAAGGFRWDSYSEEFGAWRMTPEAVAMLDGAESVVPAAAAVRDPLAAGRKVYSQICIACHQTEGNGLPGAFPPLAGSDWVVGDDRRLTLLALHGLVGPIKVNGSPWNGAMPAQGLVLKDRQIADVLTYIRGSWGNNAPPVDEATVKSMREKFTDHPPWTAETLDAALSQP